MTSQTTDRNTGRRTSGRTAGRTAGKRTAERKRSRQTNSSREAVSARRTPSAVRRRKKKRKRRGLKTVLLLLLLIFLLAGGGFAVYTMEGGTVTTPVQTYRSSEFTVSAGVNGSLRASGFADNLCVVEGDVALEGISLSEDQEGILLDLSDYEVLFSQGAFNRVYPASITKIMTAMLALKYGNLDETVTITEENVTLEEGSQVVGFSAGDQATMDQLLHCLLVYSGNDAASAIAEHVGGTTENFVAMMNSYAAELGCTGTHFTNPHGLQDENHYTTPYDIYLMLKEALNYPEFTQISQLSSYTVEYTKSDGSTVSTALTATDHYLTGEATAPKDVTILGGKTGTTSDAGNCLALLCQNAYGQPFVSIVMGAQSKDVLYTQMNSLLQNINAA